MLNISQQLILLSVGLINLITGCNSIPAVTSADSQQQDGSTTRIATESLTPTPINITLADLPQPYATESASKPPNVIPVPKYPTLQAPQGFTVNVFADNLPDVRWMTLTPDGDVLAVQSRQNKINLLQDRDNDGVAEVKQLFADQTNNLEQPLG
jgi:glucose/arabinose dehydrogenase